MISEFSELRGWGSIDPKLPKAREVLVFAANWQVFLLELMSCLWPLEERPLSYYIFVEDRMTLFGKHDLPYILSFGYDANLLRFARTVEAIGEQIKLGEK